MKKDVLLTIASTQRMVGEEPETTKLVTDGFLEEAEGVILLSYAESALTGLEGTTTCFRIEPERIILRRTGALSSEMHFSLETEHRSLYDMGFGALMLTVRTEHIRSDLTAAGGTLEVGYAITIEEQTTGWVNYRITVRPK